MVTLFVKKTNTSATPCPQPVVCTNVSIRHTPRRAPRVRSCQCYQITTLRKQPPPCVEKIPQHFSTIHLRSKAQLDSLLDLALKHNPNLAFHIRKIIIEGEWTGAGELFKLCQQFGSLKIPNMTIDPSSPLDDVAFWFNIRGNVAGTSSDGEEIYRHLHELTSVTHLTVRKSSPHLTRMKARSVFSQLAMAINAWENLVCPYFFFISQSKTWCAFRNMST